MKEFGYNWTDADALKNEQAIVGKILNRTPFQLELAQLNLHARHELGEEGIGFLCKMLAQNTSLTKLSLMNDNIGDAGAESLAELLLLNTSLTSLVLTNNKIGTPGAIALSKVFGAKGNSTLRTLYCGGNSFGDKGAKAICNSLLYNSTLTALSVSWNKITANGLPYISTLISKNTTIQSLYIGSNLVDERPAMKQFVLAVGKNSTLKTLSMLAILKGANNCDKSLGKLLLKNSSITELNLSDNNFSEGGMKKLLCSVSLNTVLTNLNISGNGIDGAVCEDFTNLLKTNKTLLSLNTGDNQLRSAGLKGICDGLKCNSKLNSLYLFGNFISDEGVSILCDALAANSALTYLNLRNNDITCNGAQLLLDHARSDWARERSDLASIDLQGNRVLVDVAKGGKKDAQEIAAMIREQLLENRRVSTWKKQCPSSLFLLRQMLSAADCRELLVPTEILYYILLLTGREFVGSITKIT